MKLLAPVELERPENRLNDAKCDPARRLWGGTMAPERTPGRGALYRLDADLALTRVLGGVTLSNGLGWSPDGTRMYFVDSVPRTVDVLDVDLETGMASGRRRLIDVPAELGSPDGRLSGDRARCTATPRTASSSKSSRCPIVTSPPPLRMWLFRPVFANDCADSRTWP